MRNTMATNVTKTCHNKKIKFKIDCYILRKALLVIIFLLIIAIICCHYAKHTSKQKGIEALAI